MKYTISQLTLKESGERNVLILPNSSVLLLFQSPWWFPVSSTCSPTCFCYHLVFSIFHLVTSCFTLLGVFLTHFVYFLLIVFTSVGLCLHVPHSLTLSHHLSFICLSCPHLSLSDFLLHFFHFSCVSLFHVMLISASHSCYFLVCSQVRFLL